MELNDQPRIDFDPDRVQAVLDDPARLAALGRLRLLDHGSNARFDDITRLAGRLLGAPICLMSIVDGGRQYFTSKVGIDLTDTPLSHSFCKYVVGSGVPLVVDDVASHSPLADRAAGADINVTAYIGAPLTLSSGAVIGSLCAIDHVARAWTRDDLETLTTLAASIVTEAELLTCARELETAEQHSSHRSNVVERLMDELRQLRDIEQRHVVHAMQDHTLRDLAAAVELLGVADWSADGATRARLAPVAAHLESATTSLIGLIDDLVPPHVSGADLAVQLERDARGMTERFGLELTTAIDLTDCELDPSARLLLVRAVIELVQNACIYSHGRRVWVRSSVLDGIVHVRVTDEGAGWVGATDASSTLSFLARELYALDGDLEPSRSGDGFAMTLRLPLRHTHAEVSPRA
ncbi:MAG: GAF domain-containing protein [Thermoleophilia bacterium]|nr:GAF domain-containing protein [Thermoleophilia bacterium]